jgi:release factor glutamine methyltransferase
VDADDVLAERLRRAGCVAAEEEAAELRRSAGDDPDRLDALAQRRERGEPLAWVVGSIDFAGLRLAVEPGVYVPRRHTAELADRAAALVGPGGRAADLCTGCGAVAAALIDAVPGVVVVGLDVDEPAARCARRNGVPAVVADVAAVPLAPASFDLVTAVAPYVPHDAQHLLAADVRAFEPQLALDGGTDGLAVVARVVRTAAELLRPGGWLVVEIGAGQDGPTARLLDAAGFVDSTAWTDAEGDLRGILAHRT